jgi:hypothetical protein
MLFDRYRLFDSINYTHSIDISGSRRLDINSLRAIESSLQFTNPVVPIKSTKF